MNKLTTDDLAFPDLVEMSNVRPPGRAGVALPPSPAMGRRMASLIPPGMVCVTVNETEVVEFPKVAWLPETELEFVGVEALAAKSGMATTMTSPNTVGFLLVFFFSTSNARTNTPLP